MKNGHLLILTAIIFSMLLSCDSNKKKLAKETLQPTQQTGKEKKGMHMVIAEEVLQTKPYSYVKVNEDGQKYWIAITRREIEIGKTYYFEPEGLMLDFESKNLGRTFDSLYFVSVFGAHGLDNEDEFHGHGMSKSEDSGTRDNISIERPEGGITIHELYANKDAYENQIVVIRGIVTKVNQGILDKNWIHIQDGTSHGENNDLTITTDDLPKIDEIVTFQGKISLNKDFGAGYKYDVIMEEGKNIDRKKSI
jgi:hypothetical protein